MASHHANVNNFGQMRFWRGTRKLKPISALTDDESASIISIDVIRRQRSAGNGSVDTVVRIQLADKTKSLEMLARHFALLTERVEMSGAVLLERLDRGRLRGFGENGHTLRSHTRRIVHWNGTTHPTADWAAQQFRMIVSGDQPHRYVIHDRDSIFSEGVDRSVAAMGLTVLRTPVRAPQANAFCERLVGTIRNDCLVFLIPLNERHLRWILQLWVAHYNRGRPHASLGPGLPDPPSDRVAASNDHRLHEGHRVIATPILGGLHHEYRVEPNAA